MKSALQKLIELYFTLSKLEAEHVVDPKVPWDIYMYLQEKKCCLFCENYSSCRSANKSDDGLCASFQRAAETEKHGMQSFLRKFEK